MGIKRKLECKIIISNGSISSDNDSVTEYFLSLGYIINDPRIFDEFTISIIEDDTDPTDYSFILNSDDIPEIDGIVAGDLNGLLALLSNYILNNYNGIN